MSESSRWSKKEKELWKSKVMSESVSRLFNFNPWNTTVFVVLFPNGCLYYPLETIRMLERIKARGVLFLCYIMYFDVPVSYDYKRGYHLANIHNRLYSVYYLGML
jgi:hypothetical protein